MTAHFSVDDAIHVFDGLRIVRRNIFENPVLAFFRTMHETYGITVSFYCFETFDGCQLSKISSEYRAQFEENRSWMRFGFHASDENTRYAWREPWQAGEDYRRITAELERIVGEETIDHMPRLHCWSGDRPALQAMKEYGLKGVLCAEKFMDSGYDLSWLENLRLQLTGFYTDRKNGLLFWKTDMRVEQTSDVRCSLLRKRKRHLEIFTHEWALNETEQGKIKIICGVLKRKQCQWLFLEDG